MGNVSCRFFSSFSFSFSSFLFFFPSCEIHISIAHFRRLLLLLLLLLSFWRDDKESLKLTSGLGFWTCNKDIGRIPTSNCCGIAGS
jgi:hypothetical protein